VSDLRELVDAALDRAHQEHPAIEYVIVLSNANSLLLPRHAEQLERTVAGVRGFYRGHVYRDALVEPSPLGPDFDHLAWLEPVTGPGVDDAPSYQADLRTGHICTVPRAPR
jgi:hypothetical protein